MATTSGFKLTRSLADVLRGEWRLSRTVVSSADGAVMGTVRAGARAGFAELRRGHEAGHAKVDEATAGRLATGELAEGRALLYEEQGELELPNGQCMPFHRDYLYRFTGDRSALVYFFKPGSEDDHLKFFHSLHLDGTGSSEAEHLCVDDLYKVKLELVSEDRWKMHWRVNGPAKDYEIHSSFEREDLAERS